VLFLSDGTATASKAMHTASLTNLSYGFAHVLTCAQAADVLRHAVKAPQGGSGAQQQEEQSSTDGDGEEGGEETELEE